MIGGHGMSSALCNGTSGFLLVESDGGRNGGGAETSIHFFEEFKVDSDGETVDRFDEILDCVLEKGVGNCKEKATQWRGAPPAGEGKSAHLIILGAAIAVTIVAAAGAACWRWTKNCILSGPTVEHGTLLEEQYRNKGEQRGLA